MNIHERCAKRREEGLRQRQMLETAKVKDATRRAAKEARAHLPFSEQESLRKRENFKPWIARQAYAQREAGRAAAFFEASLIDKAAGDQHVTFEYVADAHDRELINIVKRAFGLRNVWYVVESNIPGVIVWKPANLGWGDTLTCRKVNR